MEIEKGSVDPLRHRLEIYICSSSPSSLKSSRVSNNATGRVPSNGLSWEVRMCYDACALIVDPHPPTLECTNKSKVSFLSKLHTRIS